MLVSPVSHVATAKAVPPAPRPQKPVTQWFAEWKAKKAAAVPADRSGKFAPQNGRLVSSL